MLGGRGVGAGVARDTGAVAMGGGEWHKDMHTIVFLLKSKLILVFNKKVI